MKLSIAELLPRYPRFHVAALVARELAIPATRPPALAAEIAAREQACRERWAGAELSAIPAVAVWREAYRSFGVKPTAYRSSIERLLKNALADRPLPAINACVDAYNAVCVSHALPASGDDRDHVTGDVAFRFARDGDDFQDMSGDADLGGPPKPGEVVYADAAKVLCRRWNWRQDGRSVITPQTRQALVVLQENGFGDVAAAAEDLAVMLQRFCGARCEIALVDADRPVVTLA